jgi:hypothetical protein
MKREPVNWYIQSLPMLLLSLFSILSFLPISDGHTSDMSLIDNRTTNGCAANLQLAKNNKAKKKVANRNQGTIYYVSSSMGDDRNAGTMVSAPWRTLAKISRQVIKPGDRILLKRDDEWREWFRFEKSGEKDRRIVIGAYAKGRKPRILGSEKAVNYRKIGPDLWQADFPKQPGWITFERIDGIALFGTKRESLESLSVDRDFYWNDGVLYFFSNKNPEMEFASVEGSVRVGGLWYSGDYVTIHDIEVAYCMQEGIRTNQADHTIIENIESHHNLQDGYDRNGEGIYHLSKGGIIRNNKIHNNGVHGIAVFSYNPYHSNKNIVEKNELFNHYHTHIDVFAIENENSDNIVRQNIVYNDIEAVDVDAVGIQILGNRLVDGKYAYAKNTKVYGNLIYNINGLAINVNAYTDNNHIYNNTVVSNRSGILLEDQPDQIPSRSFVKNNIFSQNVAEWGPSEIRVTNKKNKYIDYNLYHNNGKTMWTLQHKGYNSLSAWSMSTGFDLNSLVACPSFVNSRKKRFDLGRQSDAIDSALPLTSEYAVDLRGKKRRLKWDMGAYEH